jgi:hypothetical protein
MISLKTRVAVDMSASLLAYVQYILQAAHISHTPFFARV